MDCVEIVEQALSQAKANGINDPVMLVLPWYVPAARLMWEDLTGGPMPVSLDAEAFPGRCVCTPRERACRLLRRFAGKGGADLAAAIEAEVGAVQCWLLLMTPDHIGLRLFVHNACLMTVECPYEGLGRGRRTPSQLLNEDGPSNVNLETEDGHRVPVYGRSGASAIMASALVGIANQGRLCCPFQGRLLDVPVDDDALASLLQRVYADEPHQVAEAVTALRRLGPGKDGRLLRVLQGRPELRQLAREVERELTGETPPAA